MNRWLIRLITVLLVGGLLYIPSVSHAAGAHHDGDKEKTAYIDVAVATLWTAPGILRPVDAPSASNPVDIWQWKNDMSYEQQVQLSDDGMLETQALYGNKVHILEGKTAG